MLKDMPHRPEGAHSTSSIGAELAAVADGLRRLALTLEQRRHRYVALVGVGDTDLMALGALAAYGPLSSAELSRLLAVTPSSVTTLVDRLESAQLVARRGDPADRRRRHILLTAAGEKAIGKARSWSLDALSAIEPEQLPAIVEALAELASVLEKHQDETGAN
jgi:DNA-binding MarR family transcriptional regulator